MNEHTIPQPPYYIPTKIAAPTHLDTLPEDILSSIMWNLDNHTRCNFRMSLSKYSTKESINRWASCSVIYENLCFPCYSQNLVIPDNLQQLEIEMLWMKNSLLEIKNHNMTGRKDWVCDILNILQYELLNYFPEKEFSKTQSWTGSYTVLYIESFINKWRKEGINYLINEDHGIQEYVHMNMFRNSFISPFGNTFCKGWPKKQNVNNVNHQYFNNCKNMDCLICKHVKRNYIKLLSAVPSLQTFNINDTATRLPPKLLQYCKTHCRNAYALIY
jgi:hypothetical protein